MKIKHNLRYTKIYSIWCDMKKRCNNPNAPNYKYYGAKGIAVCDEWEHDVRAFHDWAMDNGYYEGLSIDRIDVNKGYSPENCRWVTIQYQQRNKGNNRWIDYRGDRRCLSEWCEILGLDYYRTKSKVRSGYTAEELFDQAEGGTA